MCMAYLSSAKTVMEILVSNIKMSPDKPVTVTLNDNNTFQINGEESGSWDKKYISAPVWGGISIPPTNYSYRLYLKDPKTDKPVTVLSFVRTDIPPRRTISLTAPQSSGPTSSTNSGAGFNVTGYFTNSQGQKIEKSIDFSPVTPSKNSPSQGNGVNVQLKT